jgi:hypothetical protein
MVQTEPQALTPSTTAATQLEEGDIRHLFRASSSDRSLGAPAPAPGLGAAADVLPAAPPQQLGRGMSLQGALTAVVTTGIAMAMSVLHSPASFLGGTTSASAPVPAPLAPAFSEASRASLKALMAEKAAHKAAQEGVPDSFPSLSSLKAGLDDAATAALAALDHSVGRPDQVIERACARLICALLTIPPCAWPRTACCCSSLPLLLLSPSCPRRRGCGSSPASRPPPLLLLS